jgi:hypothetical protein
MSYEQYGLQPPAIVGETEAGKTEVAEKKSFTREFVVADEQTCKFSWSCFPNGSAFFCAFCGHQFVPGDEYRMVYTNDIPQSGGNPLTCKPCFDKHDGLHGLRQIWAALWEEYRTRFKWWAIRRSE